MTTIQCTDRWKSGRLATLFAENAEKNSNLSSTEALQFRYGEIRPKPIYDLTDDLKETYKKYALVRPNDIMLNGLNLNYDFVTQRVAQVKSNGIITSAYISLRPREGVSAQYYTYLLKTLDSKKVFNGMGTGIRLTLSYNLLRNLELPIPQHEEQDHIVRYLDWQVSKINKLIAARKKQITLLKELRKAITDEGILHGFTSSEMKDSGVFWLGSVPEHWSVKPLKRVCRVNASIAHLITALNDDTRVTFLPMENVSVIGEVDCTIKKPLSEVRSGFSSFAKGDVVVAKITPCFENGKGACLDSLDTEIGFGTTEFINLRPSHDINPKYLYLITMTRPFRVLGEKVMTGSAGQKRVSPEYIKNFTIGIPPLDEQNNILEEIDRRVSRIDEQIRCENESISVLFELRTRLISDVVTGQIDVRGIEVPDFDIVEEIDSDEENLDDEDAAEETEEQEE